jgi:hypothetical protein
MYFDYFPVGGNTARKRSVKEIQLASYIASEWFPSTPSSFINGFADVIRASIHPEIIGTKNIWCVNPDLATADRQWSNVTSWLLGVAFTRFIIEEEQYPWWSPVGAFHGPSSAGKTRRGDWSVPPPPSYFSIEKKASANSNLLPDYLVCRLNQKLKFEFAFVESKGTKQSIGSLVAAPNAWAAQSQSVELFYKSLIEPVTRNIFVATRVNPHAKRVFNRRIIVRAWNQNDSIEGANPAIFAHFLANHYAAICWRIGYRRLGQLMEIVGMSITSENKVDRDFLNEQAIQRDVERELAILMEPEVNVSPLNVPVGPAILNRLDNPLNLSLGQMSLTARLTRSALQIMRAIVIYPPDQLAPNIESTLRGIIDLRETLGSTPDNALAVTLNGVAVFEQNRL